MENIGPEVHEDDPITVDRLKVALGVVRNLRTVNPDITLGLERADLRDLDLSNMDLTLCNLRQADLSHANLSGSKLSGVDLAQADLVETDLTDADLQRAYLFRANLFGARLYNANLKHANLASARMTAATCAHANFTNCDLRETQFNVVNMRGAVLVGAHLLFTLFHSVDLQEVDFTRARLSSTMFCGADLSRAIGLKQVVHEGPSRIDFDTIRESRGDVPCEFLKGAGFQQWEIIGAELHLPDMNPSNTRKICDRLFAERAGGKLIRRTFISYSHSDARFVEKLRKRLDAEGVLVWLDKHELFAGGLQKQISRAISQHDVVILVLSKNSITSDWVENEFEMARAKETQEGRDVICPIAIDDAWATRTTNADHPNRVLWRKLREKYVIDFSKWRTKAFERSFKQLIAGIKLNYEPNIK